MSGDFSNVSNGTILFPAYAEPSTIYEHFKNNLSHWCLTNLWRPLTLYVWIEHFFFQIHIMRKILLGYGRLVCILWKENELLRWGNERISGIFWRTYVLCWYLTYFGNANLLLHKYEKYVLEYILVYYYKW